MFVGSLDTKVIEPIADGVAGLTYGLLCAAKCSIKIPSVAGEVS